MKKVNRIICLWMVLLLVSVGFGRVTAQESEPYGEAVKKFESIVKEELKRGRLAGLSAAFRIKNHTWAKGYGYADIENKIPATADSSFRLASVSKPFTVAGILLLANEGKIAS